MVTSSQEFIDPIQVKKIIDTEIYELSDTNKAYDYIRPVSINFTGVKPNYYKYYNTSYNVNWEYTLNASDPINIKDINVAIYYFKSGSSNDISLITSYTPLESKTTPWRLPNMVETGSYYFQMDVDYDNEVYTLTSNKFDIVEPVNPILKFKTSSLAISSSIGKPYLMEFFVEKYNSDILDTVDLYYTVDGTYVKYNKITDQEISLNPALPSHSYSGWILPPDIKDFRLKVSGKSKIDSTEIFAEYPVYGSTKIKIVEESLDKFFKILDVATYKDKNATPPTYTSSVASPGLDGFLKYVYHTSHKLQESFDIYVRTDETSNVWTLVKQQVPLSSPPNTTGYITRSINIDFTSSILYPESDKIRFKVEARTQSLPPQSPSDIIVYYDANYESSGDIIPPVKIASVMQGTYSQNNVTITPESDVIYYDLTGSNVTIKWESNENINDIYTEYIDIYYSTDYPPTNYISLDTSIRFYSGGITSQTVSSGSYQWTLPSDIGVIPTSSIKLVATEKRTGKKINDTRKVHFLKYDQGYHGLDNLSVVNFTQTNLQRPVKFDNSVLYYGDDVQIKFKRQGKFLSGSKIEIVVDDPSLDIFTDTYTKIQTGSNDVVYKISNLTPVWKSIEYLANGTPVTTTYHNITYPLPIKIRISDINKFTLEKYEQFHYCQLNKRNITVDVGDIKELWSDVNETLYISWFGDGMSNRFNIDIVSASVSHSVATNLEIKTSNYFYEYKVNNIPMHFDNKECKIRVSSIKPDNLNQNILIPSGESKEFIVRVYDFNVDNISTVVNTKKLSDPSIPVHVVNDMGWRAILGFLLWSIEEFLKNSPGTSKYHYIKNTLNDIDIPQLKISRDDAWDSLLQIKNEYDSSGNLKSSVQTAYKDIFNTVFNIMSEMYNGIIFTDDGKRLFYNWFYSACRINKKIPPTPNTFKKDDDFYGIQPNYLHTQNALLEYYKLFKDLKANSFFQVLETGNTLGTISENLPVLKSRIDDYINTFDTLSTSISASAYRYYTKELNYNNYGYYYTNLNKAHSILNDIVSNSFDIFVIGDGIVTYLSELTTVRDYYLYNKCTDTLYTAYSILNSAELKTVSKTPTIYNFIGKLGETILHILPTMMSDYTIRMQYSDSITSSVKYPIQNTSHNYISYHSSYYQFVNATSIDYNKVEQYFNTQYFLNNENILKHDLEYVNLIFSDIRPGNITVTTIESDRDMHFKNMLRMLYYFAKALKEDDEFIDLFTFYDGVLNILKVDDLSLITQDKFSELIFLKNKYFIDIINTCKETTSTSIYTKQFAINLFRYMDRFVTFQFNNVKYTLYEITTKILHVYCSINGKGGFESTPKLIDRIYEVSAYGTEKTNLIKNINAFIGNVVKYELSGSWDTSLEYKKLFIEAITHFISRSMPASDVVKAHKLLFYPEICSWLIYSIHSAFQNTNENVYANLDDYYGASNTSVLQYIEFFKSTVVGKYGYDLGIPNYTKTEYWEML